MWARLFELNHMANRKIDRRFVAAAFVVFWPWLGWKLAKVAWRFPATTTAIVAAVAVWSLWGPWTLLGVALGSTLVPLAVGLSVSRKFRHAAMVTVRSGWRRWGFYAPRWRGLTSRNGLIAQTKQATDRARLVDVEADTYMDRVQMSIPAGLDPGAFREAADSFAHATGAHSCRMRTLAPGRMQAELLRRDPLAQPVASPEIREDVNLRAVPIGCRENGHSWALPVLGSHVLCAGATGSGKGSVAWSTVRSLAPMIHAGLVRVTGIDPKGGMELAFGADLFTRFVYSSWDAMVGALEDAADRLDDRADRLRGVTRQHTPTREEPLELVLVDELLTLTFLSPRDIRRRAEEACGRILTKGRAPGFAFHGYAQEITKDVVSFRDLFPTRVALRLQTEAQVDMVLGEDSRAQGATCDLIPESMPGTGYVRVEGVPEPERVRAAYQSDDTIRALAHDYPAPCEHRPQVAAAA